MSKGYIWFAQNNADTDYVKCSIALAKSIKEHNRENKICVITDKHSKFESKHVDIVKVMNTDNSLEHEIKWANECKAFRLSPFTHTIKLESDMLWTANTDWWWNYLHQHDLVFSVDCKDYLDNDVINVSYRKLFVRNNLANIYNGLTYFRRSVYAQKFYRLCEIITHNWEYVKNNILIDCHDKYPSTDVVYALAYRILDPEQKNLINYPWFKFIHNKLDIQKRSNQYLMPMKVNNNVLVGTQRIHRVWHYLEKNIPEDLDARIF